MEKLCFERFGERVKSLLGIRKVSFFNVSGNISIGHRHSMNSDKVKGRKKSKKIGAGGDIGEMAGSVIHAEVEWEKEAQKLE